MEKTYEKRAKRFIRIIYPYINKYLKDVDKCADAIDSYNAKGNHNVLLKCGAVRIALVYSDFVIKWDYNVSNRKWAGGCIEEYDNYNFVKKNGYSKCFARITAYSYNGHLFYIMPRASRVGRAREYRWSLKQWNWIRLNFTDLHNLNVGEINGKPIVIDYALRLKE